MGFYNLPDAFTREGDSFYYESHLFATITSESDTDIALTIENNNYVSNTTLSSLLSSLQFLSSRDDYQMTDISTEFNILIYGRRAGFTDLSDEAIRLSESKIQIISNNDQAEISFNERTLLNEQEALLGTPQILDPNATFTDADNQLHWHPLFGGGFIQISYTTSGQQNDNLSVISTGDGIGELRVEAQQVFYQGKYFANISSDDSGLQGSDLKINFVSSDATSEAVQALLRSIAYQTTDATNAGSKTLSITVNEGYPGVGGDPIESTRTIELVTDTGVNELTSDRLMDVVVDTNDPLNIDQLTDSTTDDQTVDFSAQNSVMQTMQSLIQPSQEVTLAAQETATTSAVEYTITPEDPDKLTIPDEPANNQNPLDTQLPPPEDF